MNSKLSSVPWLLLPSILESEEVERYLPLNTLFIRYIEGFPEIGTIWNSSQSSLFRVTEALLVSGFKLMYLLLAGPFKPTDEGAYRSAEIEGC